MITIYFICYFFIAFSFHFFSLFRILLLYLLLTNCISYQQNIYDYRHSSDSNINSRIRFYHPVFFLLAAYIDCTQKCVFWGNCISGSAICAHRNFCVPPSPRYRNRKKPTELGSLAYYESDIDKRQPRHSR